MFSIFLRTFMNVHTPYTGHFETITNEAMKASKTLVYAYAKDLLWYWKSICWELQISLIEPANILIVSVSISRNIVKWLILAMSIVLVLIKPNTA